MNRTLGLILVVFVIGLAVGVGIAPLFTGARQGTGTQTITQNVTKLVTTTVENTLAQQKNTVTLTVTATPQQGAVTQTVTVTNNNTGQSSGAESLVQYCFSPGGNCDQVLVNLINHATASIHVLIYSFTLDDVAQALIQARDRGVDVKIVMEKDNANGQGSQYSPLKQANMNIRLDSNPALMHNKVAIIDGHIIVTGSFNYSNAANESNSENLVVLDSTTWGAAYEVDFQQIWNAGT